MKRSFCLGLVVCSVLVSGCTYGERVAGAAAVGAVTGMMVGVALEDCASPPPPPPPPPYYISPPVHFSPPVVMVPPPVMIAPPPVIMAPPPIMITRPLVIRPHHRMVPPHYHHRPHGRPGWHGHRPPPRSR